MQGMATYKLIQDIEAEDHIIGPLTLRQFIFALVGMFCWYLSFIIFVKHAYFLLVITAPPAIVCTFFAIPFGRDQPTEIWFLAKLRFWFKPRKRIWDQSGVKELVTITVPKKVERVLTKGFSQTEVQSRLKALANTLDSRGWAVKNVNLETYTPSDLLSQGGGSDRLIGIASVPQQVPNYDVQASDDILDEASNPVAQQFQSMINQSTREHRQHIIDEMNEIRTGQSQTSQGSAQNNGWFMSSPMASGAGAAASQPSIIGGQAMPAASASTTDDSALSAQLKSNNSSRSLSNAHLRTLRPADSQAQTQTAAPLTDYYQQPSGQAKPASPAAPDPAILSLANNNDLNVSTLARQAHKVKHDDEPPQDEVVVSLH